MVVIEWDEPQSNNSPIIRYHVYVSEQTVSTKLNLNQAADATVSDGQAQNGKEFKKLGATYDLFFEVKDLQPDTGYFFMITAEN